MRRFFVAFLLLVSCGDTNISQSLSVSGGGSNSDDSGTDFSLNHTTQADFNNGTYSSAESTSGGSVELTRTIVIETGRTTVSNDIDNALSSTVTFRNTFTDPVVVAYIPTRANTESLDVRVNNLTTTGATFFIEDPDGDGIASTETITYIVAETGRFDFDAFSFEAGTLTTSSNHNRGDGFGGDAVAFSSAFSATPAVLHTLNTYNNGDFKSSVCDTSSTTGFTLEQESAQVGSATSTEDIGWVAFEITTGTLNGYSFEFGSEDNGSNDGVDDAPQTLTFSLFSAAPDLVVKGNSGGGDDGYWMRGAGTWSAASHTSYAEEDQVADAERNHANETFVYAAFDPDSEIGVIPSSGTLTSAVQDLSSVITVNTSSISWSTTTPASTSVSVETNVSFDGGSTWEGWTAASNGGAISDLTNGTDVSNGQLQYRVTLSSSDEDSTPSLDDITISVTAE